MICCDPSVTEEAAVKTRIILGVCAHKDLRHNRIANATYSQHDIVDIIWRNTELSIKAITRSINRSYTAPSYDAKTNQRRPSNDGHRYHGIYLATVYRIYVILHIPTDNQWFFYAPWRRARTLTLSSDNSHREKERRTAPWGSSWQYPVLWVWR